ncbi:MAG: type II toxin-antitoxin system VapB family antitoxin [Polyangiales bacterium]
MRTTVDIPAELLNEVQKRAGTRTKSTAVVVALEEYVQRRRALDAFEAIRGHVVFDEAIFQYQSERPPGTSVKDSL